MTSPVPESRTTRVVRVAVLLVAAFLLQTLVRPASWTDSVAPDFILAAVAAIAMRRGAGPGLGLGAGAGFLQDSFSGGLLGIHASSKPATALVIARLATGARGLSGVMVFAFSVIAAVMDAAVLVVIAWITGADLSGRLRAMALGIPLTAVSGWLAAQWLAPKVESQA